MYNIRDLKLEFQHAYKGHQLKLIIFKFNTFYKYNKYKYDEQIMMKLDYKYSADQ